MILRINFEFFSKFSHSSHRNYISQNLASVISKVGSFLGKNLREKQVEELCEHLSLENMRNNPMINTNLADFYKKLQKKEVVGNVIRAGRSGQWKETMTPTIQEAFQKEIDYYSKFQWSCRKFDSGIFSFFYYWKLQNLSLLWTRKRYSGSDFSEFFNQHRNDRSDRRSKQKK